MLEEASCVPALLLAGQGLQEALYSLLLHRDLRSLIVDALYLASLGLLVEELGG